mgnify:CR=1 FL=1
MAFVSKQDKAELAPAIKAVLKKYKMKGSISVRNHSSLAVTIKEGVINFGEYSHGNGYIQVNTYWINDHYTGVARDFLTELKDAMTDYFNRSHYIDITVGKWNKPYEVTGSWEVVTV